MTPEKLVRPEILALKAYHVAPAEGMVKLDAMENPYPLPEKTRVSWPTSSHGWTLIVIRTLRRRSCAR